MLLEFSDGTKWAGISIRRNGRISNGGNWILWRTQVIEVELNAMGQWIKPHI